MATTGKSAKNGKKAGIKPKPAKTGLKKVPKKSVSGKTSAVVSPEIVPQCGIK